MGGDFWSRRRAGVAAEAEAEVLEEEQLAVEALEAEKTDARRRRQVSRVRTGT